MKSIHWIIFALAFWIVLAPFVGDDILGLFFKNQIEQADLIRLLRWDDLFLGLAVSILSLVVVTMEQGDRKHPGLKAMHWMQLMLGAWIAAAPFALNFDYMAFTWSHFVTGMFVATFALMQVTYED
ncbi:hypothetical protein CO057_01535 [Candidatus Uhrbacteria bacterium CG_4_9_14_0_2_um_filter_41_50]|uniref:SPW repeat-containing integral membrane domain-containing protein n=1 Tax=Candidatus Uhrbacteria bacterium CG_4_9_14_0_2_um_filter_41_50 TaxID=1975031 RepID=A0A2M8EPP9_9BACT|nr:MAG: hypothetical protein COZ45_00045 [Candidatus Uhrbacteria bacterium CG_4_10_14_3_um_filter_41_21]PIZ54835.1 MAG: hypothetical protein COY24_02375 [Candidatus Uhrbacteria bacterium CG_4_10_14_0_2_um_filter_41_21]PJB84325.1 MAG: hypothetical protein CO086_04125 [Candidatus Uhrbacteria bacterium CG_4_9_14_0_8_um_filter_41_16]PJC24671.1 MAG: hypothetical protein CO057_01535 [Candidatus Uhrbacteria bacterium CG_4_9_14_0_2_um_filter_41_50]PJE75060.1 MAG: hypothetical protein COV03_02060 [Candi